MLGWESNKWIDFNFYGHQVLAHLPPGDCIIPKTNPVDGDQIPERDFGVILPWDQWEDWYKKIKIDGVDFLIGPRKRFKKSSGGQGTFFIDDHNENVLEFKSLKNKNDIFMK